MKHTMVVLTLLLLVLKAWAGKITDDFEDGDLNGWKPSEVSGGEEAKWVVKNGELVFTSENFCQMSAALAIGDETWTDYEFSVNFSLKKHSLAAQDVGYHPLELTSILILLKQVHGNSIGISMLEPLWRMGNRILAMMIGIGRSVRSG